MPRSCLINAVRGEFDFPQGLKCVRENLCRPYGTLIHFPLYPALKRWAKIFRPSGAGPRANITVFSHRRFENLVLTHALRPFVYYAWSGTAEQAAEKVSCEGSARTKVRAEQRK